MSQIMTQPMMGQPMLGSSMVMQQQPMMTQPMMGQPMMTQQAMPNFEYVTSQGGVIAPSGGVDYQSASGSYYFQPNTPFVFYPTDNPNAPEAKRDVTVAKKKPKKKKSCGCC